MACTLKSAIVALLMLQFSLAMDTSVAELFWSRSNSPCNYYSSVFSCVNQSLTAIPANASKTVRTMILDGNNISKIQRLELYGQLNWLSLSRNALRGWLQGSTPFNCSQQLVNLSLSQNGIVSISKEFLEGLQNLDQLDLSKNRIESVTFPPMEKLSQMSLAQNRIRQLKGMLGQLANLQQLDLGDNLLGSLAKSDLPLPELQYLSLRNNLLRSMEEAAFSTSRGLRWLSLRSNSFRIINSLWFNQLHNLQYLDLGGNPIAILAYPLLASEAAASLQTLVISDMPLLSMIGVSALKKASNLRTVFIRNNSKLVSLASGIFDVLSLSSVTLDLSNNAFEVADNWTLWQLAKFSRINLTGNPWHCDCSNNSRLLVQLCSSRKDRCGHVSTGDASLSCASPADYAGRSILELDSSNLGCDYHPTADSSFTRYVVVAVTLTVITVLLIAVSVWWFIYRKNKCSCAYRYSWGSGKSETVVYSLVRKQANIVINPIDEHSFHAPVNV